jgi:hypothetical protein
MASLAVGKPLAISDTCIRQRGSRINRLCYRNMTFGVKCGRQSRVSRFWSREAAPSLILRGLLKARLSKVSLCSTKLVIIYIARKREREGMKFTPVGISEQRRTSPLQVWWNNNSLSSSRRDSYRPKHWSDCGDNPLIIRHLNLACRYQIMLEPPPTLPSCSRLAML